MNRRHLSVLAAVLVGGAAWACASGGVSLSSESYTAQDLAAAPYDNMYDFARAHSSIRVGQQGSTDALAVRVRSSRSVSFGGAQSAGGGAPTEGDTVTPGLGGGGGGGGPSESTVTGGGSGSFASAVLYINDQEVGAPIVRLRDLSPQDVQSLDILDPEDASSRYGGSGDRGIIAITLKEKGGGSSSY